MHNRPATADAIRKPIGATVVTAIAVGAAAIESFDNGGWAAALGVDSDPDLIRRYLATALEPTPR